MHGGTGTIQGGNWSISRECMWKKTEECTGRKQENKQRNNEKCTQDNTQGENRRIYKKETGELTGRKQGENRRIYRRLYREETVDIMDLI